MKSDRIAGVSRRGLIRTGAAMSGAVGAGLATRGARAADSIDDSLLKRVMDRGRVIVGTGATNPPWHFEDENGKLVGMDIDMAKELAIGIFGIEEDPLAADDEHVRGLIEFVVQEPNARIPNLLTDKVDIVIQFMTVTVNRATQVEFTIPYYREATTFLLPPDSPYNTIADLGGQGVTIAVLQNVGVEESTLAVVPGATVEQYPSIADPIAAMDAGRADAAGVDLSSGKWFASTTPGKYKFTDGYNSMSYSAAVKPGDQIWLNLVNTSWHEAMVGLNSKRYRASFKQWFGEDVPLPAVGFPVEFM
ncbi:MAG: transporter substrate-binding domain-containing protein [Chloroflexota bacterium]|nr:transporter substrate-binding domain-containing protein [Chloroflexota bacterium]